MAVVGTGIGGLAAALDLVGQGCDVTLLERSAAPGGKMRETVVDGRRIDAGPTVFTMRWVFEALFADAGTALDRHLVLHPADILARHAWPGGAQLDLFADPARTADAIAAFAGVADARGFQAFCAEARRMYEVLETPFIRRPRPSALSLARDIGSPSALLAIRPFATMWSALARHMRDERLRQLFGRYATYCGSSPFLAPATLMLVAHVEQQGVWLVEGGMHRVAAALAELVVERGGVIRYGAAVADITVAAGRVDGVRLASGERVAADAVVVNADPAAVAAGLLGPAVRGAVPPVKPGARSLSALTWTGLARAEGFPLHRHTVFFSGGYRAEFDALARGTVPHEPTVYVCAQDRGTGATPPDRERLLVLVNAPANGDTREMTATEIDRCADRSLSLLRRCGLHLTQATLEPTPPSGFHALFPGTGGALYGPAVHGPMATFRRPGSRTVVPGLYLAGGSTHPGAGVPMAALSGRLAASALMADLASTRRSPRTATPGGTSMRSATTGSTASR